MIKVRLRTSIRISAPSIQQNLFQDTVRIMFPQTLGGTRTMLRSPWKFETSEEKSGSLFLGLSFGKLYFVNETSNEKMVVSYRSLNVGMGKGPPVGYSESSKTDPSGAASNVSVVEGRNFDYFSFPCRGYLIGVGASSGIIGSILGMDVTGGGLTIALFGQIPVFAGVRMWGFGRAALPGAGFTGGLAHFWLD